MKKENIIELKPIQVKHVVVTIEGEGDLVLNKMNARSTRMLTTERQNKKLTTDQSNVWEEIITAIRWRDPLPTEDTYNDCDKNMYENLLRNNAPCISAFGLKKSFGDAVVRNEIDTYKTKFDNAVNIIAKNGLVPITFAEAFIDERLMSPKKGSPVLVHLNHFSGWEAKFEIAYTDNVYSLEQIVNIINLAGFGLGIGSGRTSGYGRYHVKDISSL